MRKYAIGFFVAIVFIVYSLDLRHQHSEPIVAPVSNQSTTSSKGTSSTTASSTSNTQAAPTATTTAAVYKDGTYNGSVANAYYGNVQVAAIISGGKLTAVNFLQSPNENPNSIYVNSQADPYLKQEAIKAQSSKVSIVTGATFTSQAFMQSLSDALSQAKS